MPVLRPSFQPAKCMLVILPMVGSRMWMLSDCDWSMKAPRSAAICTTVRWEISQTVLYRALMSAGMLGMFWMEPPSAMMRFLHVVGPQAHVDQVLEQPGVDDLELAGQHAALVDVGRVGLEALVVAEDLRGRGGRHGREQQAVADAVLADAGLERVPVPEVAGGDVPHVELQDALRGGRALVRRVGALLAGQVARGGEGGVVDGLEHLAVQLARLGRLERHAQGQEGVGQALDADADGAVAHVAVAGLGDGVVVDVDDAVEVAHDDLGDLVQLGEVVGAGVVVDEGRQGQRTRGCTRPPRRGPSTRRSRCTGWSCGWCPGSSGCSCG